MATTVTAAPSHAAKAHAKSGLWSWITTVDHKRIGVLYFMTALGFFLVGGLEALLIRLQLATPNATLVSAQTFNALFTMHATTMIFLALMPMSVAFFNYIVPLQIGARDVAFPRLNAFSYWVFLFGGLFLNFSFLMQAAPDGGWYGYANLTSKTFSPGHAIDFWAVGLQILGVASLAGAFNFITTIINLRSPGMSFMRMPVFTWMTLVTSFLIILAFPVITVALIELMFDRLGGTVGGPTNFFNVAMGGDPVLWQHLFWVFGHPEVYILILPAMGIASEILPVFCRKPIFGYHAMAFSMIAIAFLSWVVYGHHMFVSGMNPMLGLTFTITTMIIAVPSAIKTFNWLGTLWGGRITFPPPMLFALGFVSMFVIGGLSGIFMASTPVDIYIQDTYFIVAHIHYVVFGGSIMGAFAAIYYWFPKMFGRLMNAPLGHIHFWLTIVAFNVTFFPMHIIGVGGQMRRIYNPMQYEFLQHQQHWNVIMTVGALVLGFSQIIFAINLIWSLVAGKKAPVNPWNANTLEWSAPSPPPHLNWGPRIPTVYRGPYEYSSPESKDDFLPQWQPAPAGAPARASRH